MKAPLRNRTPLLAVLPPVRTLPILATAAALVLLAGGCLGSSSATSTAKPQTPGTGPGGHPPRPIANLTVRGVYARGANPNVFGGELQRGHFALTCYARAGHPAMPGTPAWRERLCRAILDYPESPQDAQRRLRLPPLRRTREHPGLDPRTPGRSRAHALPLL